MVVSIQRAVTLFMPRGFPVTEWGAPPYPLTDLRVGSFQRAGERGDSANLVREPLEIVAPNVINLFHRAIG